MKDRGRNAPGFFIYWYLGQTAYFLDWEWTFAK